MGDVSESDCIEWPQRCGVADTSTRFGGDVNPSDHGGKRFVCDAVKSHACARALPQGGSTRRSVFWNSGPAWARMRHFPRSDERTGGFKGLYSDKRPTVFLSTFPPFTSRPLPSPCADPGRKNDSRSSDKGTKTVLTSRLKKQTTNDHLINLSPVR